MNIMVRSDIRNCKDCKFCAIDDVHMFYQNTAAHCNILFVHDQYLLEIKNIDRAKKIFHDIVYNTLRNTMFLGFMAKQSWTESYVIRTNQSLKDGAKDDKGKEIPLIDKVLPCVKKHLMKDIEKLKPKVIFNLGDQGLAIKILLGKITTIKDGEIFYDEKSGIYYIQLPSLDDIMNHKIRDPYSPHIRSFQTEVTKALSVINNLESIHTNVEEQVEDFIDQCLTNVDSPEKIDSDEEIFESI